MDGTRKYVWSSGLSKESPDFFCAARVSSETVVAWSPDHATETDRRSPRSRHAGETFGRGRGPVGRPGHDAESASRRDKDPRRLDDSPAGLEAARSFHPLERLLLLV